MKSIDLWIIEIEFFFQRRKGAGEKGENEMNVNGNDVLSLAQGRTMFQPSDPWTRDDRR